jgi:hypothetical protein
MRKRPQNRNAHQSQSPVRGFFFSTRWRRWNEAAEIWVIFSDSIPVVVFLPAGGGILKQQNLQYRDLNDKLFFEVGEGINSIEIRIPVKKRLWYIKMKKR